MGTPGRPRKSDVRTDLTDGREDLSLQFLLHRVDLERQAFARNLGVSPATVTSFMKGGTRAPPRSELVSGLQYACDENSYPLHLPSIVHHPELFTKDMIARPPQTRGQDRRVAALSDVRRRMMRGLPDVPPRTWVTVDRIAATFDVTDITSFEHYVQNMGLLWQPPKNDRFFPFSHTFSGEHFHISFGPRGKRERIAPETGEVMPPSFARIDLHARAVSVPAIGRTIVQQYVLPFLDPNSLEVTLLDIAVDYAIDSWVALHHDERSKKFEVWRPRDPWLQNAASNVTFGSRKGERFIRVYSKSFERMDRCLEHDASLRGAIAAEVSGLWLEEDLTIGTREPDAEDLLLELRHRPEVAESLPAHVREHSHIHRVEVSVRPRRFRGDVSFDRRPTGLVHRVLQKIDPFRGHHLAHLGGADRESFWTPVLVLARLEGSASVLDELRSLARGKNRARRSKASANAFLDHVGELDLRTTETGTLQPREAVDRERVALQNVLDVIFAHVHGELS